MSNKYTDSAEFHRAVSEHARPKKPGELDRFGLLMARNFVLSSGRKRDDIKLAQMLGVPLGELTKARQNVGPYENAGPYQGLIRVWKKPPRT